MAFKPTLTLDGALRRAHRSGDADLTDRQSRTARLWTRAVEVDLRACRHCGQPELREAPARLLTLPERSLGMLRSYMCRSDRLVPVEASSAVPDACVVWFDLFNPTPEEDHLVEERLGVSVPTRDEMEEIELSARLYHEGGADYMTMTAVTKLDTDEPVKTPITFILK